MKNAVSLLIPLFVSTIRRAEELAVSMESRCWRGGEGRTRLRELRFPGWTRPCWALLAGVVAAVGLL